MKRCPSCNRTYTDVSLNFCLEDGTPLVADVQPASDPHATVRYPPPRDTGEPPATEIYRQQMPMLNQVPEMTPPQPQWARAPVVARKKSSAVWWVLGIVAVVAIIGVGLVIMLIALASLGSNVNENTNTRSNSNSVVRNVNSNSQSNANRLNTNSGSTPSSLTDDFSEQTWGASKSQYGETWYEDGEYRMRSKEKTFVVMYAPGGKYDTEDATVKVSARSVDGTASTSGYGLIIHGKRKNNNLEDYALLIYTGDEPQYQIVMHKDGAQTPIVAWTRSSVIRPGTNPNQLEARVDGSEISFYINGQYVNRITDKEDFTNGLAGLYTSDTATIAFDDLEISR